MTLSAVDSIDRLTTVLLDNLFFFKKKVANHSLAVISSTLLWSDRRAPGRGSSNFFFFSFGNRSVKKVPVGLNLTSLEEVNTVWCDPERGAGCCGLQVRRRCCGGEEERSNHSDNIWCREEVNLVVKSPSERKQAEDHRHVSLSLSRSLSQSCVYCHPLHCLNLTGLESSTRLCWDRWTPECISYTAAQWGCWPGIDLVVQTVPPTPASPRSSSPDAA